MIKQFADWGKASKEFDEIKAFVGTKLLSDASEAQTRYDAIDRLIRDILGWHYGQIAVEELNIDPKKGFVDYLLRAGDLSIVIEAKKIGVTFPTPTQEKKLKLNGSVLHSGPAKEAILQALDYAKGKIAQITVATNGRCWCIVLSHDAINNSDNCDVTLLFPFDDDKDAEILFRLLGCDNLAEHGLDAFQDGIADVLSDNRLLTIVADSDTRVDRNNVADFITPALDNALYSVSLINNPDQLKNCYVSTVVRSKFDRTLEMNLADIKSSLIRPAERIKPDKEHGQLETMIEHSQTSHAAPVTLIIAPVGVGKSTYLKHFELVTAHKLLEERRTHWVYVDFEAMGKTGNIRLFLYSRLREYLLDGSKILKTDYETVIRHAYAKEIQGLKDGPLALIKKDVDAFNRAITEHIQKDFDAVEPYVDKIFTYLSTQGLCVLVLDNIDLLEDDELERTVLSEGMAASKRLCANVIISIRDTTFVKHKDDAWLNAFELKKLWLDPPPFKEVLSRRLSLSKVILKGQHAKIPFSNGITLDVPDLSKFFDIVQSSILSEARGDFIEAMSNLNIRKGLDFVKNFLTSGHIQADRALQIYVQGTSGYIFPFQEVFKGSILGQWKYYKEDRTACLNLFDSKLSSKRLRLIRLIFLSHLYSNARFEKTLEVPMKDCVELFSRCGATENQIISVATDLIKYDLAKTRDALAPSMTSAIFITKTGGYYLRQLMKHMVYVETCMYDTTIDDLATWKILSQLTEAIEHEPDSGRRMELRGKRLQEFFKYMKQIEDEMTVLIGKTEFTENIASCAEEVLRENRKAIRQIAYYSRPTT